MCHPAPHILTALVYALHDRPNPLDQVVRHVRRSVALLLLALVLGMVLSVPFGDFFPTGAFCAYCLDGVGWWSFHCPFLVWIYLSLRSRSSSSCNWSIK